MEARTYAPSQHFHPSSTKPNIAVEGGQGIASTGGDLLSGKGGENTVTKTMAEEETKKEATAHSLTQDDHPSISELIPISFIEDGAGKEVVRGLL